MLYCVSVYADDLVVMLGSQTVVNVLIDILKAFQIFSSAKVNLAKSKAILVKEWEARQPTLPRGLVWKKWTWGTTWEIMGSAVEAAGPKVTGPTGGTRWSSPS